MRNISTINTKNYNITAKSICISILFICWTIFIFPELSNGAWEIYDSWRQGDTYSVALNYFNNGMDFLKPTFNYDGAEHVVIQLELQIVPFMSALVFKLLGYATPFVPRFINILFFMMSAIFVYKTMRHFASFISAFAALVIYMFVPVNILFARAIMPEACAMFFMTGGVWYLLEYYIGKSTKKLYLSAAFIAFAIMEKTPTMFVGILCIAVIAWVMGSKTLKSREFYIYGLISLGLPAIYYVYSYTVSTACFVSGIATKHIFTAQLLNPFTKDKIDFFKNAFSVYFGIPVVIFSVLGFVMTFNKKHRFALVLTLSMLLELATIVAIIKFNYYMIFFSPVTAVLCAIAFEFLFKRQKLIGLCCMAVAAVLTVNAGCAMYTENAVEDEGIHFISEFIEQNTLPDQRVAISTLNPIFHNTANRVGYRAGIKYYEHIPQDPKGETDYYISEGISYFVVLYNAVYGDTDGKYLEYLNTNFDIHAQNEFCTIYKLTN